MLTVSAFVVPVETSRFEDLRMFGLECQVEPLLCYILYDKSLTFHHSTYSHGLVFIVGCLITYYYQC